MAHDPDRVLVEILEKNHLLDPGRGAALLEFQREEKAAGRLASLDQILLEQQVLTPAQVKAAVRARDYAILRREGRSRAEVLLKAGKITQEQMENALAIQQSAYKRGELLRLEEFLSSKTPATPASPSAPAHPPPRLGDVVVHQKWADPQQMKECLALQERFAQEGVKLPLGEILVKKGLLKDQQLETALKIQAFLGIRAEDARAGAERVKSGQVTQAALDAALEEQKTAFAKERKIVPLREILGKAAAPAAPGAIPEPPQGEDFSASAQTFMLEDARSLTGPKEVVLVRLSGDLDGHTFTRLDQYLRALIQSGHARLVLDLKKVGYVGSAGLGVFFSASKEAREKDGDLRLANPHEAVRELLDTLGLARQVRIYGGERGAVESFRYL